MNMIGKTWKQFVQTTLSVLALGLVPGAWSVVYNHRNGWPPANFFPALAVVALGGLMYASWRTGRSTDSPRAAAFTACLINTLVLGWVWSRGFTLFRSAVIVSYAAAIVVFSAPMLWRVVQRSGLLLLMAMIGVLGGTHTPAALAYLTGTTKQAMPPTPRAERRSLDTSLYQLELRTYQDYLPVPFAMGGGLAPLPDGRIVLVTGDGAVYLVREDSGALSLSTTELPMRVPINNAAFREFAKTVSAHAPWFRVADLLIVQEGDKATVFVSHHYFREEDACVTVRVSSLKVTLRELASAKGRGDWTTVYETSPCLPMKRRGHPFAGHQIGGRLAIIDEKTLLLSIGDHEFDSVNSDVDLPQDMMTDYGKILSIDLPTGVASIWTLGHRNPQGLLVTRAGEIWSTEHGPQGGDELNFIERGANYGWPLVIYGADYGTHSWPLNVTQGRHDGFRQPMFAWTPSIGVSNLIQVTHETLRLWHNDLMVSSMREGSLLRIRLVDRKPVLVEPIKVSFGVRDLVETPSGHIALLSQNGASLSFISRESRHVDGAELFSACAGCHSTDAKSEHGIGPNLARVVGRRIGAVQGFSYSPALAGAHGTWTEQALDTFLAQPSAFLPGTSMQFDGISDPDLRRKLIEYLKRL